MSSTTEPDRAEARQTDSKNARRTEILDVAARLFAERGFNGTSMDDIAKELGMLKGSLYYWIQSKEALLDDVLKRNPILEEIAVCEKIINRKIPASERLRLMIHVHIDAWIRYPHNFRVFLDYSPLSPSLSSTLVAQRGSLEDLFKRIIREGAALGEFQVEETDLSIIVNSIFGVLNWFPRWYRPNGPASPEYISDVMTNLLLGGLSGGSRARQPG